MRRIAMLAGLILLILVGCGGAKDQKTLEVIYLTGAAPAGGVDMFLTYYDETNAEWVSLKTTTSANGVAVFYLPAAETGESAPFVFGPTLDFVDWATQSVDSGKGRALRFPADPKLTRVRVQIDQDLQLKVLEGSLDEVGK